MDNHLTRRAMTLMSEKGFSDYITLLEPNNSAMNLELSLKSYETDPNDGSLKSMDVELRGTARGIGWIYFSKLPGFDVEVIEDPSYMIEVGPVNAQDLGVVTINCTNGSIPFPTFDTSIERRVDVGTFGLNEKGGIRLRPNWWLGGDGKMDQELGRLVYPYMYELFLGDKTQLNMSTEYLVSMFSLTGYGPAASETDLSFFIPSESLCAELGYPVSKRIVNSKERTYSRVIGINIGRPHETGASSYAYAQVDLPIIDALITNLDQTVHFMRNTTDASVVSVVERTAMKIRFETHVIETHQKPNTSGRYSNWAVYCILDPSYVVSYDGDNV